MTEESSRTHGAIKISGALHVHDNDLVEGKTNRNQTKIK